MLRNYTLVTDDVDLAEREGWTWLEDREDEEVSEGGKRGLPGISRGSRGRAPVGVVSFSNTHTQQVYSFLGFLWPLEQGSLSCSFPPLVGASLTPAEKNFPF